jgi:hypothetical protein
MVHWVIERICKLTNVHHSVVLLLLLLPLLWCRPGTP